MTWQSGWPVKRFVYTSGAVHPISCLSNIDILRVSRLRNAERGISGFLCRSPWVFAQVLEGPDAALDAVVEPIRRDRRHWGLSVWFDGPVEERMFPDWSMALAFCDDRSVFEQVYNRNRTSRDPGPDALMRALTEAAEVHARAHRRPTR